MTDIDGLRPCPFGCPDAPILHRVPGVPKLWKVSCANCDCGRSGHFSEVEAVAAWNKRPEASAALAQLQAENERLTIALEWALDNASDSDHPHYPDRVAPRMAYAVWEFPYLISGTPFGGGVGHANFPTALDAVEAAAAFQPKDQSNG